MQRIQGARTIELCCKTGFEKISLVSFDVQSGLSKRIGRNKRFNQLIGTNESWFGFPISWMVQFLYLWICHFVTR